MTGWGGEATEHAAVQARLMKAIMAQQAHEVAGQLLSGEDLDGASRALALAAQEACESISAHMLALRTEALDVLAADGIAATAIAGPAEERRLQFHRIGLGLPRRDLLRAVGALASAGFETSIPITPARARILAATAHQLTLIRADTVTARLTLHLEPAKAGGLPQRLRPGLADLGIVNLPGPMAPLYYLAKPCRVAWERATGRRSTLHETDYLGTPDSLIGPLLRALELDEEDIFVDLGCGDGRIAIRAAEQFGCRAVGVELNLDLVARASALAAQSDAASRIRILRGDARSADLSEASAVFMFLPLHLVRSILPQVLARVRPGARVAVHEQTGLDGVPVTAQGVPVFSPGGITNLHVWRAGANQRNPASESASTSA